MVSVRPHHFIFGPRNSKSKRAKRDKALRKKAEEAQTVQEEECRASDQGDCDSSSVKRRKTDADGEMELLPVEDASLVAIPYTGPTLNDDVLRKIFEHSTTGFGEMRLVSRGWNSLVRDHFNNPAFVPKAQCVWIDQREGKFHVSIIPESRAEQMYTRGFRRDAWTKAIPKAKYRSEDFEIDYTDREPLKHMRGSIPAHAKKVHLNWIDSSDERQAKTILEFLSHMKVQKLEVRMKLMTNDEDRPFFVSIVETCEVERIFFYIDRCNSKCTLELLLELANLVEGISLFQSFETDKNDDELFGREHSEWIGIIRQIFARKTRTLIINNPWHCIFDGPQQLQKLVNHIASEEQRNWFQINTDFTMPIEERNDYKCTMWKGIYFETNQMYKLTVKHSSREKNF